MRRRVRTLQMMRHDSANDGGTSSVTIVSSDAPIILRSQYPRIGSRIRNARMTKNRVGMVKMMNGARQPSH